MGNGCVFGSRLSQIYCGQLTDRPPPMPRRHLGAHPALTGVERSGNPALTGVEGSGSSSSTGPAQAMSHNASTMSRTAVMEEQVLAPLAPEIAAVLSDVESSAGSSS